MTDPTMTDIVIAYAAMSFFIVGGIARASGRDWLKWTVLSLIASPLVTGLVLLASIIVKGKAVTNQPFVDFVK